MKNDLEHLESPFLSEEIRGVAHPGGASAEIDREASTLSAHSLEQVETVMVKAGELDDDELGEPGGHAEMEALYENRRHLGMPLAHRDEPSEEQLGAASHGDESDDESAAASDEASDEGWLDEEAGCAADHEFQDLEAELFDSEAWTGSAEQQAFRDQVLAAHLASSRNRRGAAQRDLSKAERDVVPGTGGIEMARDAAVAAGQLLAAANASLLQAQQDGDADALRTIRLTATSGYRASDHQRRLWLSYFPGYYKRTRAARERLAAGPHADDAVAYMLRPTRAGGFGLGGRIAAPGYSNHQNGIAIDLKQERKPGHTIRNDSGSGPRRKWRDSWFHGWLRSNAAKFSFRDIATEEWHWEYRPAAGAVAPSGPAPAPADSPTPPRTGDGRTTEERVRFAQRVLRAVAGERLADDGDLGPRTRAALQRFRRHHDLGAGGVLDAATELALAQRALEELAQASMFARPGQRDARTDAELIRFKAERGLGSGAELDAATRRALTDALAARRSPPPAGGTSPPPLPASAIPHLGGKLWTFAARVVSTPVAVFLPAAALGRREVDVLVFAHGLLNGCPRPASVPDGLITSAPFRFGSIVSASNRPIVLVVPLLDWNNPGGAHAFGRSHPRWHALAKPAHLNALIDEVLAEVGRVQSAAAPALQKLVVAGHSRAYDFLEPLAHLHADAEMRRGALARLAEVWSFDATYGGNLANWQAWLAAAPGLRASVFYRQSGGTKAVGDVFFAAKGGRLSVVQASETHCAVPGKRLPALLVGGAASEHEMVYDSESYEELHDEPQVAVQGYVDDFADDYTEDFEPDGEFAGEGEDEGEDEDEGDDELDADDLLAAGEQTQGELEAAEQLDEFEEFEHAECCGQRDESLLDGEELVADDEHGEYDDEQDAELALEEQEAGDKTPMVVPVDNPVPFAPLPPAGSYWPVVSSHPQQRVVSYMYQAPSGIIGRSGRMFLAGRKGASGGKAALRWHAGVDLFAFKRDVVVACEAGRIVAFSFFYKSKSGQRTYKLLVEHEGSGIVANYGEVTSDSLSRNNLKIGMCVRAGQAIGLVSDTSMLHFETYGKGTQTSHQWWKADKQPPRELLNPTRYLLHLAQHGLRAPAGGESPSPVPHCPAPQQSGPQQSGPQQSGPAPRSSGPASVKERVRFAQRVLNACECERLATDGVLGKGTRAALQRFRQRHGVAASSTLDESVLLALAQRALEELAQQSMFPAPGSLDQRTREVLSAFKAQRGLGSDPRLDAGTRSALTDALAKRQAVSGPASCPPAGSSPRPARATPPPGGQPAPGSPGKGLTPPSDPAAYRKFRLTTYHVVDQHDLPTGAVRVPIYDQSGQKLAESSPAFFAHLSLEGTGRLTDGRLINVTGKKVPVSHDEYAEVLRYHERAYARADQKRAARGKSPTPTQYSGIDVSSGRVVRAFAFHVVAAHKHGVGYGTSRGVPYTPFRTLAADIGHTGYSKVDPTWKGKGGLVPPGTRVYIKEYNGLHLPDGTVHDGWFVVNDTGGAIFGAHFDVFTGTEALRKQVVLPAFGQVWFAGIEQRIAPGYTYGLSK